MALFEFFYCPLLSLYRVNFLKTLILITFVCMEISQEGFELEQTNYA